MGMAGEKKAQGRLEHPASPTSSGASPPKTEQTSSPDDQKPGSDITNHASAPRPTQLPIRLPSKAPPPGQTLTGKQEHYLKRELVSEQVRWEISELNSPTALHRFGAPFKSDFGEVSPLDSELPILRYIFVHHVREFPFLDKAREKEFWQDKLQVFLESFAKKNISSSEDRLEETKRRKLALKAQKLVELMIVSGVRTSSGFEERIRFSELEIVDANAIETGVLHTIPEGNYLNGWDVNVAGVRTTTVKRNIRYHKHAEFILRVKRENDLEFFVGRRYGDFSRLRKSLRTELPGKILPSLPRKNRSDTTASGFMSSFTGSGYVSDSSTVSTVSTPRTGRLSQESEESPKSASRMLFVKEHGRNGSSSSRAPSSKGATPRPSMEAALNPSHLSPVPLSPLTPRTLSPLTPRTPENVILYRESQRISLRAFLRSLLHDPQIAQTQAMEDFLTKNPLTPADEDTEDIMQRKHVDEKRMEEQKKFYEIARRRAAELDVYMEQFRRDIVERNGLTMLFKEIKEKQTIQDLSLPYQKFAEWLRIEVAATIYHLFLAEDNSPEVFAQAKRIHSLIPYTIIKNVIRVANPAAVMSNVLDVFLAQPFGARSLLQRIFSLTLNDGIRQYQKAIDALAGRIGDRVFVEKLRAYTDAAEEIKAKIREEAASDDVDWVVVILRSELLEPALTADQIGQLFNAYVAFNNAVENVDEELKQGAQLFSYLKQLMKLYTRQRDKAMMLSLVEEPVTLQLFRDLFTVFYEPLVRVYKSANVYGSVTDFAAFFDDLIGVVGLCREQDASADPNQTVQAFIDLCQRHEHKFYKFVHEVHTHDNGLFGQLMGWIEGILQFLRQGPKNGTLDINALLEGATSSGAIDKDTAIAEVNQLIGWQEARKKWHHDKTRQKMAAEGNGRGGGAGLEGSGDGAAVEGNTPASMQFRSSDFGLDEMDLDDMAYGDESDEEAEEEAEDELDPIEAERRRRAKRQDRLRRNAGEPVKPPVAEVHKLKDNFLVMLRMVLAE